MKRDTTAALAPKMNADETLLWDIIAAFSRYTQDIAIETEGQGMDGVIMNITVNRADHPRVLGGQAKHLQAIRTIFQYIAHREGRSIRLMLLEPETGTREGHAPFTPNPKWKPDNVLRVLKAILDRVLRLPYEFEVLKTGPSTLIEVKASPSEVRIARGIQPSLHPIIHAIGKNEGAEIYLETPERVVT